MISTTRLPGIGWLLVNRYTYCGSTLTSTCVSPSLSGVVCVTVPLTGWHGLSTPRRLGPHTPTSVWLGGGHAEIPCAWVAAEIFCAWAGLGVSKTITGTKVSTRSNETL